MKDEEKGTPSPYQDAGDDVEITAVSYMSSTQGKMVYLGKTIRKIARDGKVSYTLLDPADRKLGPPLDTEEGSREIWKGIATMLEHRAIELSERRKKNGKGKDKDKGKER